MPSKVYVEIIHSFTNVSGVLLNVLGMDKLFHRTRYDGCNYLSMLGLKSNHLNLVKEATGRTMTSNYNYSQTLGKCVFSDGQVQLLADFVGVVG